MKLNADFHIWLRILRQLKRGIKRNVFIVLVDLVYEGNIQVNASAPTNSAATLVARPILFKSKCPAKAVPAIIPPRCRANFPVASLAKTGPAPTSSRAGPE